MPFDGTVIDQPKVDDAVLYALEKARAKLARRFGWTQRHFHRWRPILGGSYCILGALGWRSKHGPWVGDAEYKAARALVRADRKHLGCVHDLMRWNDADSRRKADVLALFDRAIAMQSGVA